MPGETILVVDDEESIVQLIKMYLEREGFRVRFAFDGKKALELTKSIAPSLIVLDLMLPEIDGLEVCKRLRSEGNPVPIMIVTAKDEDIDKILGLELGADDYLTKPFNPRELVARVKAILRREERIHSSTKSSVYEFGNLRIDNSRHQVTVDGTPVDLRGQEYDLLLSLAENKSVVLTREQLLDKAWGFEYYGQTRTVDVHIAQLRRKLAGSTTQIETITGVGYKLTGG
jgi:DNA-binding response OmpR family regulator